MASAYPAGLDTFATNKANATATTTDHPTHHNDLADAVNKIEAALGINPLVGWALDVFAGRAHTFSDAPNASYPATSVINGVSVARLLTQPDWGSADAAYGVGRTVGWRAADIAGSAFTVLFDYGAGVEAQIIQAVLTGGINTGGGVFQPSAVKLESSDDNAAYSTFGTALTGLNDDPVAEGYYACIFDDDPVSARYWRWTVNEPSPGSGDNWIMLRRLRAYGRVIT